MSQIKSLTEKKNLFSTVQLPRVAFSKEGTLKSAKQMAISLLSILVFLGVWQLGSQYLYSVESKIRVEKARTEGGAAAAKAMQACIVSGNVECQPNTLPSPAKVAKSAGLLWQDHKATRAKRRDFNNKVAASNKTRKAQGLAPITYTGRPSFIDQIFTSLKTVFAGFLLSLIIAIPSGILIGLNATLRSAVNWLIQIFKPVSPVVWLLLVFMIVKTMTLGSDTDSSFLISFISVGLCAMWATLVNTAMGVSSVDKDYLNVANVLQLGVFKKIFKIILPSSIPMIFTGMRITISVAWMVLIAIELLAQSPGLGSFVWEEFQNGSSESNSKIIVAMFVIGIIGFLLDRMMLFVQRSVDFNKSVRAA